METNTEKFTFFYGSTSPFSQHYSCSFKIGENKFNCCEQAMMYYKAILFDDLEIASKVLETSIPSEQKKLGRLVKNFNGKVWEENRIKIVYSINRAKYTQNKNLLNKLLATEGTTLVEASPRDCIWGIGLSSSNPKAQYRYYWRGKNLLGAILTQLRENLMKEVKSKDV